jgi:hypothetical protein
MKQGRYLDMSEETYHSDPCDSPSLSRGVIKDLVMSCPAKAWWNHPRLNPNFIPKTKDIFDLGHASHDLFLRGLDNACVIDAPDWRTKEAKEKRDQARMEGKYPLLKHQHESVAAMVEVAHRELYGYLGVRMEEGQSEVSYIWREQDLWMRVRLDWEGDGLIIDYKSTGTSSNPEDYTNIVTSTGLDIQAAFYPRGVHAVTGKDKPFLFFVQECTPPFLCSVIELDAMFGEMGQQKVDKGIRLWKRCLETNTWPGYTSKVYTVEPRPYHLASWEQRMNTI